MERDEKTNDVKKECLMVKRGSWKPEEDLLLKRYIETHGEGKWTTVSKRSGLMRGAKSCRMRWKNHLRPNIKRGHISEDEEDLIIRMHKLLGNRWSLIAGRLPGRTDNEVKNYWNTHIIKRKLQHQGSKSNKIRKLSHKIDLPRTSTESKDSKPTSNSSTHNDIIINGSDQGGDASPDAKATSSARAHNDTIISNGTDEGCSELCTTLPYNPSMNNTFSSIEEDIPWWLSDETTLYEPFLPSLDYFLSFESFGHNSEERWNKYLNCL